MVLLCGWSLALSACGEVQANKHIVIKNTGKVTLLESSVTIGNATRSADILWPDMAEDHLHFRPPILGEAEVMYKPKGRKRVVTLVSLEDVQQRPKGKDYTIEFQIDNF